MVSEWCIWNYSAEYFGKIAKIREDWGDCERCDISKIKFNK